MTQARGRNRWVGRLALGLVLALTACGDATGPELTDQEYYARVCQAAGMTLIEGTRTCVAPDGSYINLEPRKR
jgi:hypothetical protein